MKLLIPVTDEQAAVLRECAGMANRILESAAEPGEAVRRVGPADIARGVLKQWAGDRRRKGGVA